jgi:hypothetical protein
MFTASNSLPVVYQNDSIDISRQLSDNKYEEMVVNAVYATVKVMNVASGTTLVSSLFMNLALN